MKGRLFFIQGSSFSDKKRKGGKRRANCTTEQTESSLESLLMHDVARKGGCCTLHPANLHTYSIGHAVSQRNIATIHHTSAPPSIKHLPSLVSPPDDLSSLSLLRSLVSYFHSSIDSKVRRSNRARREQVLTSM